MTYENPLLLRNPVSFLAVQRPGIDLKLKGYASLNTFDDRKVNGFSFKIIPPFDKPKVDSLRQKIIQHFQKKG